MVFTQTTKGNIEGTEDARGILRFAGIPYAQPPVGDLRWASPQEVEPWSDTYDATKFGNTAIQSIDTRMIDFRSEVSEDCLYLNVWTQTLNPEAKQPVMFWIHGGGFLNGTSSASRYDGAAFAAMGITFVSINYRLGAFGFFNHPETGTNFGLQDWIAGLEWVKDNISNFGGDPDRVLIFGQSAGGAATRALLHAPQACGLFSRAIVMSAGYEGYAQVESPTFERTAEASRGVLQHLGAANVKEAREASAEEVRAASLKEAGIFPPEGQLHTPANLVWYPIADDETMKVETAGWAPNVPVMFGVTADESRLFMMPHAIYAHPEVDPKDAYTPETLGNMAKRLAGEQAAAVLDSFEQRGLSPYEGITEITSEAVWFEPCFASVERFAAEGQTIYPYKFQRVSPSNQNSGMLAYHSSEIPYVFGHIDEDQTDEGIMDGSEEYNDEDIAASVAMQGAWVSFARDGVPSRPDGSYWTPYGPENRVREVLDTVSAAEPYVLSQVGTLLAALRDRDNA